MANIMYDYNKTRLMYGLRKLALDQPKKEENKPEAKPAPAPAPAKPDAKPAAPATKPEQGKPQPEPQKRQSALASVLRPEVLPKGILGTELKSGPLASLFQARPGATPAAPNYKFTQLQLAAARKRRALITAVAGTVGFGAGYVANLLISDDPTLTGGLLTGGIVGALAGGAGYALSDPYDYLKRKADNEFKNNNPGGGGKGKG